MLFGECCSQWIISSTKRFHRQKFLHGLCTAPAVKKIGQESRCSQGIQSPQSETSGSQMNFVAESRERLSVASNTFTTTLIFLREGTLSWYTDSRSTVRRASGTISPLSESRTRGRPSLVSSPFSPSAWPGDCGRLTRV